MEYGTLENLILVPKSIAESHWKTVAIARAAFQSLVPPVFTSVLIPLNKAPKWPCVSINNLLSAGL